MPTKEDLIQVLIKDGYLKSPVIIDAFKAIDRKDFLPEELKDQAYVNEALPIGNGQTISQPLVVAFMLELLNIKPGEKILEVGSGSGWQTAILSYITEHLPSVAVVGDETVKSAPIISIERIEELHNMSKKNISKYGFAEKGQVKFVLGDGSQGYAASAPYDKIIAAASAQELPESWVEQLKIGGRIVAPVKESIIVIDKVAKDKIEKKDYFGYSFVPLVKG
ncbi:MAG: protein-L-isoaspartate(D-aspartate) O-methyltransferase [Candidatus Pacebacteria bacterium]|nr:protein-L-isoaspartate(D-aspartate) O-methyltransferase [Candidatus Paceibacterota bacterium]